MTDSGAAPVAVVRQWLSAPPAAVYDEWTDPDALAEWMCPRPARCLNVTADPRIGGALRFEIEDASVTFLVSGNFLALDRPRQLAFTWSCSTWPDPTVQSLVTVTIEPDGADASVMTIEHALLPPGLAVQHARGWTLIAQQLAGVLAGRPAHRGT